MLIGLGALLIVGIYVWGRGYLSRISPAWLRLPKLKFSSLALGGSERQRLEPTIGGTEAELADVEESGDVNESAAEQLVPERIVTIRFVAQDAKLTSERAILALRAAGLRHGRYGIFHLQTTDQDSDPLFSVANLTEPGSFDLTNLSQSTVPGMSFFMVLPGAGDPVERFDKMVKTARAMARDLEAELHDEKGSSWSIQRERYIREELVQYRHQFYHAPEQ